MPQNNEVNDYLMNILRGAVNFTGRPMIASSLGSKVNPMMGLGMGLAGRAPGVDQMWGWAPWQQSPHLGSNPGPDPWQNQLRNLFGMEPSNTGFFGQSIYGNPNPMSPYQGGNNPFGPLDLSPVGSGSNPLAFTGGSQSPFGSFFDQSGQGPAFFLNNPYGDPFGSLTNPVSIPGMGPPSLEHVGEPDWGSLTNPVPTDGIGGQGGAVPPNQLGMIGGAMPGPSYIGPAGWSSGFWGQIGGPTSFGVGGGAGPISDIRYF